jgi:hypothetical protein
MGRHRERRDCSRRTDGSRVCPRSPGFSLRLQLYFTPFLEDPKRLVPKGHVNSPSFRGLKPPAPSGIFDLQPSF